MLATEWKTLCDLKIVVSDDFNETLGNDVTTVQSVVLHFMYLHYKYYTFYCEETMPDDRCEDTAVKST